MKKGEMSLLKKKIGLIDLKFGNQIFFGRRKINIYPHTSFALFYLLYSDSLERKIITINSYLNLILKNERAEVSNNKGQFYSFNSQMSSKINLFSSGNIQLNLPVFTNKVVNNSCSMIYQKSYNHLPANLLKNYKNVMVSLPIHDGRFGLFSSAPSKSESFTKVYGNKRDKNVLPLVNNPDRGGQNLYMDRRGFPTPPEGFLSELTVTKKYLGNNEYVHDSKDSLIPKSAGTDEFSNSHERIGNSKDILENSMSASTELNHLHYFKRIHQDIEQRTSSPEKAEIDVTVNKKIQNNVVKNSDKPEINVTNLADEVYRLLERKIRVEKERRGIFR